MIALIAAMTKARVIGRDNKLPWDIPEDLAHFRKRTSNSTVIMGRKTYESIGRPLPNRNNIVLSSQPIANVTVCTSIPEAIETAKKLGKDIYVIGGSAIFAAALPIADKLIISWVKKDYPGDVYFPPFDEKDWQIASREDHNEFELVVYTRTSGGTMKHVEQFDPALAALMKGEEERQRTTLTMIPSENHVSAAIREACSSYLINKYSEGYPGKRYYQGDEFVDKVELLAIERAKQLFGAEHANVQPLSGSPANQVVFQAFLKPGDTFMGFDLKAGGHLTHGSPVNFSGKHYRCVPYNVDPNTELIDMEKVREIALREKPKLIISGLTAYPRTVDFRAFQDIAEEVGAIHLADISHIAGLVAAGKLPNPVPFTDVVMTTTHKTLRGPRGAILLCKAKHATAIDKALFPGLQGGPHQHTTAAMAIAFKEAMTPEFKQYAAQTIKNAAAIAEVFNKHGLRLVTGGTENHLLVVDLRSVGEGIGKEVANALEEAGFVCNANTIPYDPSTPFKPSGLRMGTPALTTRGMKESEMKQIGEWMVSVIKDRANSALKAKIRTQVAELCKKFPLP